MTRRIPIAARIPLWTVFAVVLGIVGPARTAWGYPPAPGFTVHGTVRDEFGWAVESPDSFITFKSATTGTVMARSVIMAGGALTENYRVTLPIDHRRSGPDYRPDAVANGTAFTIEVTIQGITYFPTPVAPAASTTTASSEFLQLDLVLGDDSDGDGLPDQWEQWQLEAGGLDPSQLDLLTRDGDPDGDGINNADEYLAGTFAFLIYDNLSLRLVEVYPDDWSRLEFLAVIDKTYVLERSADMINWEPAPFGLWQDRTTLSADWTAPDTVLQTVQAPPGSGGRRWFYKLTVH
jgi:hypothetical protein